MAARVARHGAQRRTAGAANALEAFAVAGSALSVVALMTVLAGGPAPVDGSATGDDSDPGRSQVVSPTSIGSGSGAPRSTTRPAGTGGASSGTQPDESSAFPPGPPTTAPPTGLGPSSPLPVGTTPVGTTPPAGLETDADTTPVAPPTTTPPATTPTTTKPEHPVPPSRPVTPGVPPTDLPRATPKG